MIEGLRLLPWFQEAARRDLLGPLSDCEQCMSTRASSTRQLLGCGYEPPPADALAPMVQPWSGLGYEGPAPTVCPGYSTNLPEVAEVNRAHFHWSKGALGLLHPAPTDALLRGVEVLDIANGNVRAWLMTPRSKGGGGE